MPYKRKTDYNTERTGLIIMGFIRENIGSIIIILILALAVTFAVIRLINNRKKGGCCGCSHASECQRSCKKFNK